MFLELQSQDFVVKCQVQFTVGLNRFLVRSIFSPRTSHVYILIESSIVVISEVCEKW